MCCPSCSPLNQDVGSNFDKIAEIIQTRNKSQVRTFYNTEVKRINTVLAPLGVQVDPSDDEEVHTAMHSWHSMKDKLGPGGSFQELCKKPQNRNLFAWDLKKELDKSVWAEGKKEAKLKSLGLLPAVAGDASGKVLGVMSVKTTANRGRPKGSGIRAKNTCKADSPAGRTKSTGRKAARRGSVSPNAAVRAAAATAVKDDSVAKEQKERLMLQLFPIDTSTRAALVAGGFNPHLELTFRAKKSVTGLMQHLITKWAAALPHLPAGLDKETAVLQLYPFEAASASDTKGAWNHRHEGVTATDIFDAIGRPAAFRVRYGWVPSEQAAVRPHLAPPPPVYQQSLARSRSRTPSPPNLSPRKRSAEEMTVAHPSFCQAPVQAGSFAGMFGGGNAGAVGSVFGSDLALFGGAGGAGASTGADGGVVGVGAEDFTLPGFGADFSNMCREMGLGEVEASRGVGGNAAGLAAARQVGSAAGAPLASAAPDQIKGYSERQVISEFGGGDVTVGTMLENDAMFSLTQMLGDVPEGNISHAGAPVAVPSGPSSFAGMFAGGSVADVMAMPRPKLKQPGIAGKPRGGEKKPRQPYNKKPANLGQPYVSSLVMTGPAVHGAIVPGYINNGKGFVPVQQQPVESAAAYYPHMAPQGDMAATMAKEAAASASLGA